MSVEMIADKFSNATWNGSYILDTTSRYMKNVNASISPFANKIPPTKVVVPIPTFKISCDRHTNIALIASDTTACFSTA